MSAEKTAILFFSHRPGREWQNKQFVRRDYAKNRQVAEAFYQQARRTVEGSGLPVLEVNGPQQRGDDFGGRLANAFVDAFAQGYERVIAVGSDCPRLHEVDWSTVTDRLDDGRPVLGPTPERDGTYLIGLHRSHFDTSTFAALPWTTPDLFPALVQYLRNRAGIDPSLLASRDDVNGHDDLLALLRSRVPVPVGLVAALRSVLGPDGYRTWTESLPAKAHFCGCRSRAPPSPPEAHSLSGVSSVNGTPGRHR